MNNIKTYLLDVSSLEEKFEVLLSGVKKYRQEKIAKLTLKNSKLLSLGVELLIKKACLDFDIDYESLEIEFNESGKPYFKNSKYFFNTAHSGKYAICVISDKEIGIDIEEIKDFKEKVAERIFTKKEKQYIEICADKEDMFYRLWTLKESYSKCIGKGLNIPFNQIELSGEDNRIVVNGGKEYQFYEQKYENYRIAWCVKIMQGEREKYSSSLSLINY